jgi:hypothetical protein
MALEYRKLMEKLEPENGWREWTENLLFGILVFLGVLIYTLLST